MKIVSKSLEETAGAAKRFLEEVAASGASGGEKSAQIAGLVGDLGAGKTAFAKEVAKLLGIKETVTSPTFVIMKIYELDATQGSFKKLIHIDAYRLESGEELMKLNFAELAANPENLILIEWPENVGSALSQNLRKIYFRFIDEHTREIEF